MPEGQEAGEVGMLPEPPFPRDGPALLAGEQPLRAVLESEAVTVTTTCRKSSRRSQGYRLSTFTVPSDMADRTLGAWLDITKGIQQKITTTVTHLLKVKAEADVLSPPRIIQVFVHLMPPTDVTLKSS